MKNTKYTILPIIGSFAILLTTVCVVESADYRWTSSSGSNFTTLSNWQTFDGVDWVSATQLPGATDRIVSPTGTGTMELPNGNDVVLGSIEMQLSSNWIWGTTGITGPRGYTVEGNFDLTASGSRTLTMRRSTNNVNMTFYLNIEGNLSIGNNATLRVSREDQPLDEFTVEGTTTINSGGSLYIAADSATLGPVINNGTLSVGNTDSGSYSTTVNTLAGGGTVNARSTDRDGGLATGTLILSGDSTDSATFSGSLVNGIADSTLVVHKQGGSTQEFSGASTYTGGTVVSGGTLLVSNLAGSGLGSGNVEVNAGVLGGGGQIILGSGNSLTVDGGALMGGDGVDTDGTLTIDGNLLFEDDSTIVLTLDGTGGSSTIHRAGGDWTFALEQTFFFEGTSSPVYYSGLITGLDSDPGVGQWTISNPGYFGMFIYNGGSVDLDLTVIPEPSAAALALLSGIGIALMLRRRRRA